MEHKELQECVRSLAMMAETDSFFISCYLFFPGRFCALLPYA
jgi:hypothetical protein